LVNLCKQKWRTWPSNNSTHACKSTYRVPLD
jgi:hypothetical protein